MFNPDIKKSLTIIMLGASVILPGCSGGQGDLATQLPGNWQQQAQSNPINLTIYQDGKFSYYNAGTDKGAAFTNMGTWQIKKGRLILTATNQIGEHARPLGELVNAKIVKVDSQQLQYETQPGQTETFQR